MSLPTALSRPAPRAATRFDTSNNVGGSNTPYTHYPSQIGASRLHAEGLTGRGITVAIVDTGLYPANTQYKNTENHNRLLEQYNAIRGREIGNTDTDRSGHGMDPRDGDRRQ